MVLFQRTKTYFDSWLKVTLSCALQPMIVAGFIAFAMNLYDDVLFGGCKFLRHDYSNGTNFMSTFEPRLPQGDYESCVSSPGYMILGYILGYGWDSVGAIIFTVNFAKDELNLLGNSALLLVFSYIMGFFIDNIYSMAADLTSGTNMSRVALNVKQMATAMQQKITENGSKALDKLQNMGGKKGSKDDDKGKKDDKGGDDGAKPQMSD
jgi:type IV secretion system protein VirB6